MEDPVSADQTRPAPHRSFFVFLAAFYAAWILRVVLLLPIDARLHNVWLQQCWSQGLRIALCVLPVFLYLRVIDRVSPVRFLLLDTFPRGRRLRFAVAVIAIFLELGIVSAILFQGGSLAGFVTTTPARWAQLLAQMSIIAFAEEVLFRGFILGKLSRFRPQASSFRPVLISSILFILIHIPGWLYMQGAHAGLLPLAGSIFVISVVLGVLFQVTRSLWPPIILHLLNNIVSATLFS